MSTQVTFFCGTETDVLLFFEPSTETPGLWTAPVTIAATSLQTSIYEPSIYTLGVTDVEAEPVTVHPDSTVVAGAAIKMNIAGLSTAVTSDATRVVPGSSVDGQLMWCAGDTITAATNCPTVPVSYFPSEAVSYVCTSASPVDKTSIGLSSSTGKGHARLFPEWNWAASGFAAGYQNAPVDIMGSNAFRTLDTVHAVAPGTPSVLKYALSSSTHPAGGNPFREPATCPPECIGASILSATSPPPAGLRMAAGFPTRTSTPALACIGPV
jgi:hypothetical protein